MKVPVKTSNFSVAQQRSAEPQLLSWFANIVAQLDKSWKACNRQGIVFLPLAVESLGAWHPSATAEIKKLGSALARHTGEEEATTTSRLFQRLSISLMRGNAALFNNRCPPEQSTLGDVVEW